MPRKEFLHTDFDKAFQSGTTFYSKLENLVAQSIEIGILKLPTGKILVHDPGSLRYIGENSPFAKEVAPGQYPVHLSIVRPQNEPEHVGRVAAAMIRFDDAPVVRWENATTPGENLEELADDDEPYGQSIDGGLCSYCDFGVADRQYEDHLEELYEDQISKRLTGADAEWCEIVLEEESGTNLFTFTSGFGDGCYSSFWGLDKNERPVALATDFWLLIETIYGEERVTGLPFIARSKPKFIPIESDTWKNSGYSCNLKELSGDKIVVELAGNNCGNIKVSLLNDSEQEISQFECSSGSFYEKECTYKLLEPVSDRTQLKLSYIAGFKQMSTDNS